MQRRTEVAFVVGIITAAVVWLAWGSLAPRPVVQDEYSYVLQSKIFAQGHWTAAPAPVPSSFQQPHVLTYPRVASKYPPGHALLLALGAAVGEPWLASIALSAGSGVLIFLIVESFAGAWIALACWLCWLADPITLRFQPGYYSEVTSGLLWLASLWALLEWRRDGEARWLYALAAAIGWMAITRPFTAAAFAVPVGIVAIRTVARRRSWRALGIAVAIGTAILAILPIWNHQTTGSWTRSPLAEYRREYLPFDKPGFGFDSTPPTQVLSPSNADTYAQFAHEHAGYTLERVPRAALDRLRALATAEFGGWRLVLVPLVIIGVATASADLWFALACAASLFIFYLSYGYYAGWTLYDLEALPTIAFCVGGGIAALSRWFPRVRESTRISRVLPIAAMSALALLSARSVVVWRRTHVADATYDTAFWSTVGRAPFRGAVVFVRFDPKHHPHSTLVGNSATLATDRVWVAIDDPAKDAALVQHAGGRIPLLFNETTGDLRVYGALLSDLARLASADAK